MKLEIKNSVLSRYDDSIPPSMKGLFAKHPERVRKLLNTVLVGKAQNQRLSCAGVAKYRVNRKLIKKGDVDMKRAYEVFKAGKSVKDAFFKIAVFRKNDKIAKYTGTVYEKDEFEAKYPGDMLAPYAGEVGGTTSTRQRGTLFNFRDKKKAYFLDSACHRGAASFANSTFDKVDGRGKRIFPRYMPNAAMRLIGGDIWLVATGSIFDGDEILIRYGKLYTLAAMSRVRHRTTLEDVPADYVWRRGWWGGGANKRAKA